MSEILQHLAEIESRRIHLRRGFGSLFVYCVERLGFSEDEACRRIDAARMARKFPVVLSMVAEGTVTLSVLGLLHPKMNEPGFGELLDGVKRLTVRRAKEWLAARFPVADVPDNVRKLPDVEIHGGAGASAVPPGRKTVIDPLSADRFLIKTTVSRRVRDKLELARDLVRHKYPSGALEAVLEMALDALIENVSRKKLGKADRPRRAVQADAEVDGSAILPESRKDADLDGAQPRSSSPGYVNREARRDTVARDGLRCAHVAPDGTRCTSRAFLEFDHVEPVGLGGGPESKNIRILCRAHNRLAAEDVFGREYVTAAIERAQAARRVPMADHEGSP
jgi:hypothetical protein